MAYRVGKAKESHQTIDPVCGMTVEKRTATGSLEHDGERYFFCSAHCLEMFRKDPARFIKSTPRQPAQSRSIVTARGEYTCPMHPEVRQPRPGACPKCGMALEPVAQLEPQTKIEYTCPMHPQIVRDKPGNCPICGMALEPRTVSLEEEENPELIDMTRRF